MPVHTALPGPATPTTAPWACTVVRTSFSNPRTIVTRVITARALPRAHRSLTAPSDTIARLVQVCLNHVGTEHTHQQPGLKRKVNVHRVTEVSIVMELVCLQLLPLVMQVIHLYFAVERELMIQRKTIQVYVNSDYYVPHNILSNCVLECLIVLLDSY